MQDETPKGSPGSVPDTMPPQSDVYGEDIATETTVPAAEKKPPRKKAAKKKAAKKKVAKKKGTRKK